MTNDSQSTVTQLLRAWRDGDTRADDALLGLVYDELRELARRYLRRESPGQTLQPTALVHEAYLRLVGADVPWVDRSHFFSVAARTMRRVLVDRAREKAAVKRGAGWVRTTLEEGIEIGAVPALELLKLDAALAELEAQDARVARASELHYFGGLSYEDTAKVLDVSAATVHRDLRFARVWLHRALLA
ncbi:MAG: sigma-70 family RNA polymerase sigma factor [Candidatus Eisenbacteria bacterium]|uniref:Sigma-70 family RNA polymerase sigma factor n=1 Tax=Eiseniibacteriota bacterium TaxID=2212470 RepID=A0A956N9E9_UNCEI|nr:sigma-70 family RNA polymerase sigma factor [Candidatus Eisenbacteria bacterium]MCB9465216.1 sigma-70 family RNA polymerase sigma factor [Candidatus Eisenbacteria bacterium]